MPRRFWTPAEDAILKAEYATTPAHVLARKLNRGVSGVYQRVFKILGPMTKTFRWKPAIIARLRRLHAKGFPDRVIAERMGLSRDQVKAIRRERLKLPTNPDIEGKRRAVQKQMATLGIRHGGDLRRLSYRRFAESRGWPSDLRPREVQILEAVAVAGGRSLFERLPSVSGSNPSRTQRNRGSCT